MSFFYLLYILCPSQSSPEARWDSDADSAAEGKAKKGKKDKKRPSSHRKEDSPMRAPRRRRHSTPMSDSDGYNSGSVEERQKDGRRAAKKA